MADNIDDTKHCNEPEALWSRRAILKTIAGAPLVVTFGLAASPLMRFLKPTMKPGEFFQTADFPTADRVEKFQRDDFSEIWTCLPFILHLKYTVFNPEQYEIRKIPGFVIRIDEDKIIAFSRICPRGSDHILSYVLNTADHCCGCVHDKGNCGCIKFKSKTPVLVCPQCGSVFDVRSNCRVLAGPASCPPRRFNVEINGKYISIIGLEQRGIA